MWLYTSCKPHKNATKSAVRNFLPAFGAPSELIISLLIPGGSNYLFKIPFLVPVFFSSFAKLRARRRQNIEEAKEYS